MARTTAYRGIAVVAGFALALLMIATTSRAVWVDDTDNTGNTIASGSVTLTDDDGATALFSVTDAAPGDTWIGCIDVIYQGTVDADVLMSDFTVSGDSDLADELDADVALSSADDCTAAASAGSLDFGSFIGGGAPGLGESWSVTTAGDHRSYEITVTFDADADNDSQNSSVSFAFTWTATSN